MRDFLIKSRLLTNSLFSTDDLVNEEILIVFVNARLGREYRPFISSLHSQPNLLFDDFLHLIINEDPFLKK